MGEPGEPVGRTREEPEKVGEGGMGALGVVAELRGQEGRPVPYLARDFFFDGRTRSHPGRRQEACWRRSQRSGYSRSCTGVFGL